MLALVIAAWDIFRSRTSTAGIAPRGPSSKAVPANRPQPSKAGPAANVHQGFVDDDGRTLWASPTAGNPLELSYLPAGVQIIVALRPKAIADHPEGE